ncbi:31035_t:CDS:1 [Gigaspora margarita]|uniref:31035_t:CDS:1 n=1 Tax=Gigaspora margarita TaxID=4874 RepID=A0ABN7UCX2_GIGMA|nr:31035_t:CDS:1 [Gigaspora margarita]
MPFMAARRRLTNDGVFDCAVYDVEDVPILYTTWEPDPIGPDGSTTIFYVSQTLTEATTVTTQLFFAFNDQNGRILGYSVHPVKENITVIQDSYNVIIPRYIPPTYSVTVMIKDYDSVRHCSSFTRYRRS